MAVGLARLEVPSTLITQVGHDERGEMVVAHVTGSDAEIVAVPPANGRTSTAIARLDASGGARYEFDLEWSLPHQELPPCQALHVGSLGTALEPGRESVLDLVEQAVARELFISYDANLREPFVDDRERTWREVRELGARCTLVKLSDEDADLLAPGTDPDEVARTLLTGGAHRAGAAHPRLPRCHGLRGRPGGERAAASDRGGRHRRRGRCLHGGHARAARRPRRVQVRSADRRLRARAPRRRGRRGGCDHV